MVKLVRLSTADGKAIFKCNFDTDVIVKPNAQVALRNIVFQPDRVAFIVSAANGSIATEPVDTDSNTSFTLAFVEVGRYNVSNFQTLIQEVTNTLNRTLSTEATGTQNNIFSCYRVRHNPADDSRLQIIFRLSPVCPPRLDTQRFFSLSPAPYNKIVGPIIDGIETLRLEALVAGVADERFRAVSNNGIGLSKGTGIYYVQIRDSAVSVPPENNGFGIGLTLQRKDDNSDTTDTTNPRMDDQAQQTSIRATARNFEIQFQDMNTAYKFRSGGLGSSPNLITSGFTPQNGAVATIEKNDILMIKVTTKLNTFQKVISGHVVQEDSTDVGKNPVTVVTRDLFEYVLTDEDIGNEFGNDIAPNNLESIVFTPYIFIRGASGNIVVQHLRFTPDTTVDAQEILGVGVDPDKGYFPMFDDNPLRVSDGLINAGFETHIPQTPLINGNDRFNALIDPAEHSSSITIGNELGEFLGMDTQHNRNPLETDFFFGGINLNIASDETIPYDRGDAFQCGADFNFFNSPRLEGRDFYLVESINLNLDSYNSMVKARNIENQTNGERRNILDTIPDANVGFGVVEYIPNELVYIDIKNSSEVNLRNVNFRILDEDMNPVPVFGQSNMTIIIKD